MSENQPVPVYTEAQVNKIEADSFFKGKVLSNLDDIKGGQAELKEEFAKLALDVKKLNENKADKGEITSWNIALSAIEKRTDALEKAKAKLIGAMFILGMIWPILSGLLLDWVKARFSS